MDLRSVGRRLLQGLRGGTAIGRRRTAASDAVDRPRRSAVVADRATLEDWEARIREAGLSAEWAERLAPGLVESSRELGRAAGPALLRGALVAMTAQREAQGQLDRSLRDVREVERLLGAFSGELEKLDEVLEVLSAYAQRMRPARTPGPGRRLLH